MKKAFAAMVVAVAVSAALAESPTVSDVKVQQRYPWNALVDIDYTINGDTTGIGVAITVQDLQNGCGSFPCRGDCGGTGHGGGDSLGC